VEAFMKIGIIFPGYGSQYIGMGKELYDQYRIVQEYFEEASNCLDINFIKLCFATSEAELKEIDNAYLSIFLISSAIYALLKEEAGIIPDLVAGYGVGEYSAIHAAGGLSFPDGLYFIKKYVSFYKEALKNLNASIVKITGIKSKDLEAICEEVTNKKDFAQISSYNTDTESLVVGTPGAIAKLSEIVKKQKGKIKQLSIEYGVHSKLVENVIENLKTYLPKIDFKDLQIPLVKSTDARIVFKGEAVKNGILNQAMSPILWNKVMKSFVDFDLIIEIGPGTMLSEMFKEKYPEKNILSLENQKDLDAIKELIKTLKPEEETKEISDDE
jgi:[acyl-carrier-protein] S-malonyltransferase